MSDIERIIKQLQKLETERINPDTVDIDQLPALEIARKINQQDQKVAAVVASAIEPISKAAELFAKTITGGNRVFYIGAGTSGRLGVLDAAECPPTFGTDPEQIVGLISGGYASLVLSLEGIEDDRQAAKDDLRKQNLTTRDFVIGIAASTRTPYTLAGLEFAKETGCRTAFIICNQADEDGFKPDILIELPVGPETITGSTRMKSGTAQKLTLNMISTTAMVLMGKTYGNLMIDLQAKSEKLAARSRKILMDLLEISMGQANDLLRRADGSVKLALVMFRFDCDSNEATEKLKAAGGFISRLK